MHLCRLTQGNQWVFFLLETNGKRFVAKYGIFLEEFLTKGLSGRTIEFDEVIEPEQHEQSSAVPEVVSEAAAAPMSPVPMAPVPTLGVVPEVEVPIEP